MTVLPYSVEVDEIQGVEVIELAGNRYVCDLRAAQLQQVVSELLVAAMESGTFLVDEYVLTRLAALLDAKSLESAAAALLVYATYARLEDWDEESADSLLAMLHSLEQFLQCLTDTEEGIDLFLMVTFFEAMWRVFAAMLTVKSKRVVCDIAVGIDIPNIVVGSFGVCNSACCVGLRVH
jgi:hypothetical protein